MRAHHEVVITEPSAMKALAHPARIRVIDELFAGRDLTATECSVLTGLTPSAMSYHLRALHRWGVIEPAETLSDGRERRWRAAGTRLRMQSGRSAAGLSAEAAAMQVLLAERMREAVAWTAASDSVQQQWRDAADVSSYLVWVTPDEAAGLNAEIHAVVDRYRQRRDPDHRPEGTHGFRLTVVAVPVGGVPPGSTDAVTTS